MPSAASAVSRSPRCACGRPAAASHPCQASSNAAAAASASLRSDASCISLPSGPIVRVHRTGRDAMSLAMTRPEREAFLSDVHVGVISIEQPERGPLSVPIWYAYQPGGELWLVIDRDSGRLLERAGRFSLCVQSEQPPYKYVSVQGPITAIMPCGYAAGRAGGSASARLRLAARFAC